MREESYQEAGSERDISAVLRGDGESLETADLDQYDNRPSGIIVHEELYNDAPHSNEVIHVGHIETHFNPKPPVSPKKTTVDEHDFESTLYEKTLDSSDASISAYSDRTVVNEAIRENAPLDQELFSNDTPHRDEVIHVGHIETHFDNNHPVPTQGTNTRENYNTIFDDAASIDESL